MTSSSVLPPLCHELPGFATVVGSAGEAAPTPLKMLRRQGREVLGLASLPESLFELVAACPEALLAGSPLWVKQTPDRQVAITEPLPTDVTESGRLAGLWCVKLARSRRWWVRCIMRIYSLRSWNAFRKGLELRRIGVSTPQPLLVASYQQRGVYQECLVTEAIPHAISLQAWLKSQAGSDIAADFQPTGALQKRTLATQLGWQIQRLHRAGFDHRDLKASNLLLSRDEQIWIIDLDGVTHWPWLPRSRRVQNLSRMWAAVWQTGRVTPTDALRFLRTYLTVGEWRDWKPLWRQIAAYTRRKTARRRWPTGGQSDQCPK